MLAVPMELKLLSSLCTVELPLLFRAVLISASATGFLAASPARLAGLLGGLLRLIEACSRVRAKAVITAIGAGSAYVIWTAQASGRLAVVHAKRVGSPIMVHAFH